MSSRDPRRTSTAHTSSKRTSLLPRPSSIAIDPSALIAQHAQLTGSYPITIGPGAVLHPHAKINRAVVEAAEIGEGSVVEVGAVVGRGAVVGKYCTISAASIVPPYATLPDYTVVFSGSQKRVDKTLQQRPDILEQKMAVHQKQLEMFRRLIANNIAKWTG
ncbi:hypothetical protein E8E12_010663 [Didymella heteroderae]|uniref:Dynactin subunit 6 n=1 Tax=Didymella heteroderae TaxID=1769908 RepID=A0A9P5C4J8_9PLEO|nr:hypothetical protein E8E12_010663 [Didymella heteroderae]